MRMGDDRTPSTSPENATHGNGNGNGNGAVARRRSMDVDVDAAVQGDTLEPASGKAKDKPRLACQPCRLVSLHASEDGSNSMRSVCVLIASLY